MAKRVAITKLLSCFLVFVLLMGAMPVSIFASSTDDNVKFRGVVTGTTPEGFTGGIYWDISVDEWISGSLPCEEVHVAMVLYPDAPWGSCDPDISKADSVEVYGGIEPHEICTVCLNGESYYIKKIEGTGCGKITHWETKCHGIYHPGDKVGAEMEFESLMAGGYNFKGVIIIRSPTGAEYSNSEVEWVPSAPNPHGKFAAADALYVKIPEGASAGKYDMKLELWNDDIDELCDETEWKEGLFTVEGNKCPVLSDGKVEPLEGGESTNFVFSVTYKDEDGDEPVGKYVRIIGFQGTNKVYDETKEMIRGSGDIKMGVTYTYFTILPAADYK